MLHIARYVLSFFKIKNICFARHLLFLIFLCVLHIASELILMLQEIWNMFFIYSEPSDLLFDLFPVSTWAYPTLVTEHNTKLDLSNGLITCILTSITWCKCLKSSLSSNHPSDACKKWLCSRINDIIYLQSLRDWFLFLFNWRTILV